MPELPDVESFRQVLLQYGVNERITRVDVRDVGVIHGQSGAGFARRLKGTTLGPPDRKGKWLLAPTSGPTILMHFGMTGSLVWLSQYGAGGTDRESKFDRVIFQLSNGQLIFRDQRKLRGLWLAGNDQEMATIIGPQGPDALGLGRDAFFDRLQAHRGKLKSVLMDQMVVAGLANMLSDEVLWRANIHPTRRFADLTQVERSRLHRSFRQILQASVSAGHIPRRKKWLSSQRSLEDPRCPRGHGPLRTSRIGQRTSYWCPICQPVGA